MNADPYWNDDRLAEIAAFLGVGVNAATRRAAPLFGAMHRARLLAAVSMRMAQPVSSDSWETITPVEDAARSIQLDKRFHDAAYRWGDLSLSVDRAVAGAAAIARAATGGSEPRRQSAASLNRAIGSLADLAGDRAGSVSRLMLAVAEGIRDFVASVREMPAIARWMDIPRPDTARHVHFDVSGLRGGGYRLDVTVCLETSRPDTEALLTFAFQIDRTGRRVIRLIVPPEMRLLPA